MTNPPKPTPPKSVHLRWTGSGREYVGAASTGEPVTIDAKNESGPGPMDALLLSLAGCMAVDVQVILERSRVPITGLEVATLTLQFPSERSTAVQQLIRELRVRARRIEGLEVRED